MIGFARGGKPRIANKKCRRCSGSCKQHIDLVILRCPSFCMGVSAVGKSVQNGAVAVANA